MTADKKIKNTTRVLYGIGQVAVNAKDALFHYYFLFFFNSVLGLSGSIVGMAKLVALVFDAITDPLMGGITDNFRSKKYGRRHLFILIGVFPLGLSLWLLFSPPASLSTGQLIVWMIAFAIFTRLSLTIFFIPYISLTADLTDDYRERTLLTTSRIFFGNFAGIILGIVFVVVFSANLAALEDGSLNRAGFSGMGLVGGVVATASIIIAFLGTRAHIPDLIKKSEKTTNVVWWRAYHEIVRAFAKPSFRTLSIGFIIVSIMAGVATAISVYMATFYWGLSSEEFIIYVLSIGVAIIPGALLAPGLTKILDKKWAAIFSILMFSIFYILPILGRTFGLIPGNGEPGLFEIVVGFTFIGQIFSISIMIVTEAMMADVASEYELKTGRRQEGILFSAVMFARKASFGLGGFIAGVSLDLVKFPTQQKSESVEPEILINMGLLMGPIVFVLCLIAGFFLLGYPITRETHARTIEALHAQRAI